MNKEKRIEDIFKNYMEGYLTVEDLEEAIVNITYLFWNSKYKMGKKFENGMELKNILHNLQNCNNDTEKYVHNICNTYLPRMDKENFKYIIYYLNDLSEKELIEIICKNYDEYTKYNQATPNTVNELVYSILENVNSDEVLDLCSYKGGFLVNYAKNKPEYRYNGVEINWNNSYLSTVKLLALKVENNISSENIFNNKFDHEYDKIFCDHPFNIKLSEHDFWKINSFSKSLKYEFKKGNNSDWCYLKVALDLLSDKGKACVLMNTVGLNKKSETNLRKEILENNYIEAVIDLPVNLFNNTNIGVSLLVLSKNNKKIKFIDAKELYIKNKYRNELKVKDIYNEYMSENNTNNTKIVDINLIRFNQYSLDIENYFEKEKIELKNAKKIEDVAKKIFRGYQVYIKDINEINENKDSYKVININNIENGEINNKLQKIYTVDEKINNYLLEDKDLILPIAFSTEKIAVVQNKNNEKLVTSGNFIVLRLYKDKMNSFYLKMFLESEKGKKVLGKMKNGRIAMGDFKNLEIPVPSIEEQEKAVIKYLAKKDEIKIMQNKILNLESNLEDIINNEF